MSRPSSAKGVAVSSDAAADVVSDDHDGESSWNGDEDADEQDDGSSSDSDFLPGSDSRKGKAKAKKTKKRALSRLRKGKSKRVRTEPDEASSDAASEKAVTPTTLERGSRKKQQQTWTDDGCMATYSKRMHEFELMLERKMRDEEECFYYKPKVATAIPGVDKEDGDDEDVIDGGFHDEAKENNTEEEVDSADAGLTRYTPEDIKVTDSGVEVPKYIYDHLFPHQRECLEWLMHLHERNTGGILGDEMGLGKTVQIASFLGALHHARRLRTVLLLCPASVLLQWVREFHKWYPPMRVVLLHASGSGVTQAGRTYAQLIDEVVHGAVEVECGRDYNRLTERFGDGGVVLATYESVRQYQERFIDVEWDYVVLDEGHRIRNPDAEITLVCKQFKTVHRIILTGTPIQNRLKELWSLFDFVYPGKLGTLPTFDDEFVLPIRTGGYANASRMQVLMAYKCALVLKDLIHPFMLRRTKKEVQVITKMPEKMEHILFCNLTDRQVAAYQLYLQSPEVAAVLRRDIRPFRAISILRHICNHPDLVATMGDHTTTSASLEAQPDNYGDPESSGKLIVLGKVLSMWKAQGHRVLLFTQTRKMLDILQSFASSRGYTHCRLDGGTSVKERQSLLDAFNAADSKIFLFLLTTRAGGIGINLTGADRVVIFDPDWNPSTDLQARERSWRLGQTKQVTIYRLITNGTIEEKIYHRQIFKQYLTTKVLHDPKRKRCFNRHTLRDLFVLGDTKGNATVETNELFLSGQVLDPNAREGGSNEEDKDNASAEDGEEGEVDQIEADDNEDGDGDGEGDGGNEKNSDNDAILKHLFEGGDVQGVFNHEAVESDGVQNQEAELIEMESDKIAQSALSALKASCALIRQQRESVYTPTWTGRSGAAGDPAQRSQNRFGNRAARGRRPGSQAPPAASAHNPFVNAAVSSREMLERIRNRRDGIASRGQRQLAKGPAKPKNMVLSKDGFMGPKEMAKQLHAFLVQGQSGGRTSNGVTTEQLLDAFANVIAPKDKLVFRNMLRDMAVCVGRRWKLKDEYAVDLQAARDERR